MEYLRTALYHIFSICGICASYHRWLLCRNTERESDQIFGGSVYYGYWIDRHMCFDGSHCDHARAADLLGPRVPRHDTLFFWAGFMFTAAQIIASATVRRRQQGIAGSLIATLLSYGLATGLGFAGTVELYTNDGGQKLVQGYRNALYLGVGMCGFAAFVAVFFVRIPKNVREGWDEDDMPEAE